MKPRVTHTSTRVELSVSSVAYREIRSLLEAAGYQHTFGENDGHETLDMDGILLTEDPPIPASRLSRLDRAGLLRRNKS